jgi:hypothetical protein
VCGGGGGACFKHRNMLRFQSNNADEQQAQFSFIFYLSNMFLGNFVEVNFSGIFLKHVFGKCFHV